MIYSSERIVNFIQINLCMIAGAVMVFPGGGKIYVDYKVQFIRTWCASAINCSFVLLLVGSKKNVVLRRS